LNLNVKKTRYVQSKGIVCESTHDEETMVYTRRFTLLFEAFILELVKFMPVHQICQLYETYDSKVWTMVKTYTHLAIQAEDYSDVR